MKLTIRDLQELETEMLKEVSVICHENDITYYMAYGTALGGVRHEGPIPWDADADIIVPYNQLKKFIDVVRKNLSDKFFLDFHDINPYYTATFPRVGLKGYSTVVLHLDVFIACGLPNSKKEQNGFFKKTYKLRQMHFYKIADEKYRGKMSVLHRLAILFFRVVYYPFSLEKIREKFYSMCDKNSYESSEYIVNPSGGYGNKEIIPKSYLGAGRVLNYSNFTVNAPEEFDSYLKHFYNDYMLFPSVSEREVKSFYIIHRLEIS